MVNRVLQAKNLKRLKMRRAYLKKQNFSYNPSAAAEIRQKKITLDGPWLDVIFPGAKDAVPGDPRLDVERKIAIELELRQPWQGPMTLQGLTRFNKIKVDDPGYSRIRNEHLFLFFAGDHFYYVEMRRGVIRISDVIVGRDAARRIWKYNRIKWAVRIPTPIPPD